MSTFVIKCFNFFVLYMWCLQMLHAQYTFSQEYNQDFRLSSVEKVFETPDYYVAKGFLFADLQYSTTSIVDTQSTYLLFANKETGELFKREKLKNNTCRLNINSYLQSTDGNFYGAGYTVSPGDFCGLSPNPPSTRDRMYLNKFDRSGDLLWERTYGDTLNDGSYMVGNGIVESPSGGLVLFGNRNNRLMIMDLSRNGDTLNEYVYQNLSSLYSHYYRTETGYLCIGRGLSSSFIVRINFDFALESINGIPYVFNDLVIKENKLIFFKDEGGLTNVEMTITELDFEGNILHYLENYEHENMGAMTPTQDGNYVIVKRNIAKIDPAGNTIWSRQLVPDDELFTLYTDIIETDDGGLLLGGKRLDYSIMTKLDCEGNFEWDTQGCMLPLADDVLIFPNPVVADFTIQLPNIADGASLNVSIYTVLGQRIYQQRYTDQQIISVALPDISTGVYFYSIELDSGEHYSGKIIKE